MVLHIYSPTIIKLQMLCRSEDATKERRHLWKISCYFPLHWGRRKKLLLFMKISRGKRHEANSSLDKTAKLGISVLIPQPGPERRSSQHDLHSQLSTGQCRSEKTSSIFEEMFGLNISEGSLTFNRDDYFMSHEWSQKQKEPGLLLPKQLLEKKGKTNHDENQIQVP